MENSYRDGNTDHLTCLLYAGQGATVGTGQGTMGWFKIGKGAGQGSILSPLFNSYTEYVMWDTRLDESQARTKIAGRNFSNLRYADDTILWQKAKRN